MKADYHVHTKFSWDSEAEPERTVEEAIKKGLTTICFTEHQDTDYTEPNTEIDFDTYIPALQALRDKYQGKIEILTGMEYGLQPHLEPKLKQLASACPFDYVIGSVHLFDGFDPYYPGYFEGKTDEEGYRQAFEITLKYLEQVKSFDALGHIDYVVRCGNHGESEYSYKKCGDYLDAILKLLIERQTALELNTGGWKKGLPFAHPHPDVLKRYKELGGEMITIGSDAHTPEEVGYGFDRVKGYLEACGFKYYTEFRQRTPVFCALG